MNGGGQQNAPAGGSVDLSPGLTTVAFDPIVRPLRIPVPAGVNDDPSRGEWLLAFKDDESWRRGRQMCHGTISEQCEMGARMGCSISAANACRVPWWKQALLFMKVAKLGEGEREACEEREMMACLAGAKETCKKFARDTCDPVFAEARIAESHVALDPRFTTAPQPRRKSSKNLQNENAFDENAVSANRSLDGGGNEGIEDPDSSATDYDKVTTNYRASKLMDGESIEKSWVGSDWSGGAVEGQVSSKTETPADGWEGGLIRPKLNSKTNPSGDSNPY